MSSRIRQLVGERVGRQTRWTRGPRESIRAYAVTKQHGAWPCVSTRSAELTMVLDGEMVLELGPKKQVVRVAAGEACLVPKRMTHGLRLERPTRILIVDVQHAPAPSAFRHVARRHVPAKAFAPFTKAWMMAPAEGLALLAAPTTSMLARVAAAEPLVLEPIPGAQRASLVKEVIEQRFDDPPSLAELARLTKTREFYVMRAFKQHFGFTPMQYAQFLRTEYFCWELLGAKSRSTLLRLSGESGFGDYATFERRMRVVFGRAPSTLVLDDAELPLGPG